MNWTSETPFAITVCDKEGNILEMNDKSKKTFEKWGTNLIGESLLNCHPEPAKSKLIEMLNSPRTNAYTIEKNGIKKLIYQSPWYENQEFMGFVELSLEIPMEMPHFVRK
jgi:transcriptional regulator with PAS, ATPase and Fis domain